MSRTFNIDVSRRLHRLMSHVDVHVFHLGCMLRGLSEENEVVNMQFKGFYHLTNKQISTISSNTFKIVGKPRLVLQ